MWSHQSSLQHDHINRPKQRWSERVRATIQGISGGDSLRTDKAVEFIQIIDKSELPNKEIQVKAKGEGRVSLQEKEVVIS